MTVTLASVFFYFFSDLILKNLKTTLVLPGSISPIDQRLFVLVLVMLLVLGALSSKLSTPTESKFFLVFISLLLSVAAVKYFADLGIFEQNYYYAKFLTILTIGLVPILFLFIPIGVIALNRSSLNHKLRIPFASVLISIPISGAC